MQSHEVALHVLAVSRICSPRPIGVSLSFPGTTPLFLLSPFSGTLWTIDFQIYNFCILVMMSVIRFSAQSLAWSPMMMRQEEKIRPKPNQAKPKKKVVEVL